MINGTVFHAKAVKRSTGWFVQVHRVEGRRATAYHDQSGDCLLDLGSTTAIGRPDDCCPVKRFKTRRELRDGVADYNRRMQPCYRIVGGLH